MKNFDLGRKGLVSVLALLIGVGAEKYGGGLSPQLLTLLISIVSVFTGANVLSQKIGAGGSSLPQNQDQSPSPEPEDPMNGEPTDFEERLAQLNKYITDLDNVCGRQFTEYNKQHEETLKLLKAHGNSINGLSDILNGKGAQRAERVEKTIVNLAE